MPAHPKLAQHPKAGAAKPLPVKAGPKMARLPVSSPGVQARDGVVFSRVSGLVKVKTMTPWMKAMYGVLADGKWHDREELLTVGSEHVPASRAYSTELARLSRRGVVSTRKKHQHVAAGRRFLASQALLSAVRWQGAERKGDRFRMTPVARTAWRAHEKAAARAAR